jgi:hypothetical protein
MSMISCRLCPQQSFGPSVALQSTGEDTKVSHHSHHRGAPDYFADANVRFIPTLYTHHPVSSRTQTNFIQREEVYEEVVSLH